MSAFWDDDEPETTQADRSASRRLWSRVIGVLLLPLVMAGLFLAGGGRGAAAGVTAAVVDRDRPVVVNGVQTAVGRTLAAQLVNNPKSDAITWVEVSQADAERSVKSGRFVAVVTIPSNFSSAATAVQRGEQPQRTALAIATSPVTSVPQAMVTRSVADAAARSVNTSVTAGFLSNLFVTWGTAGTALGQTSKQARQVAVQAESVSQSASKNAENAKTVAQALAAAEQQAAALAKAGAAPPLTSEQQRNQESQVGTLQTTAAVLASQTTTVTNESKTTNESVAKTEKTTVSVSSSVTGLTGEAAATQKKVTALKAKADDLRKQAAANAGTAVGYQAEVDAAAADQAALQLQLVAVQKSVNGYVGTVAALNQLAVRVAPATTLPNPQADDLRTQAANLRALAAQLDRQPDLSTARKQAKAAAASAAAAADEAADLHKTLVHLKRKVSDNGVGSLCPYESPDECRKWNEGAAWSLQQAIDALESSTLVADLTTAKQSTAALATALDSTAECATGLAAQARAAAKTLDDLAAEQVTTSSTPTMLVTAIQDVTDKGADVQTQSAGSVAAGTKQVDKLTKLSTSTDTLVATSGALSTSADAQATSVDDLNAAMAAMASSLKALQNTATAMVGQARTSSAQAASLTSSLQNLANSTSEAARQADTVQTTVTAGTQTTTTTQLQQLTGTIQQAASGSSQVARGAQQVSQDAATLASGSQGVATAVSTTANQLPTAPQQNQQAVVDALTKPVQTTVTSPATIAWVTLVLVLAVWVGAMAAVWGFPALSTEESPESGAGLVARELLPRMAAGVLQALAVTMLAWPSLSRSPAPTDNIVGFVVLMSLVFVVINRALAAWLGGWGLAVGGVLGAITLAAVASNVLPRAADDVQAASPVTAALNGLRAVATGGSAAGSQVSLLLLWGLVAAVFAALGTLSRRVEPAPPREA